MSSHWFLIWSGGVHFQTERNLQGAGDSEEGCNPPVGDEMNNEEILPRVGLVRLSTVLRYLPISKTQWLEGVRKGRFPEPVRLGPRTTCWRCADLWAIIEGQGEAPPDVQRFRGRFGGSSKS